MLLTHHGVKNIRTTADLFGANIDAITWDECFDRIHEWGADKQSRVVCVCNSHSLVTARRSDEFRRIVNSADLATPDGAPVAFMLRRLGYHAQERINGPDLMWRYCALLEHTAQSIFLYGGSERTLSKLRGKLMESFPGLKIAGAFSPPFRPLAAWENDAIATAINESGANVVWVSLGCPKQEVWMDAQRNRIRAVLIGVGAAFDYHAGTIKRAPLWMQGGGLEWLHRLASEPRRLWKRYLVTNSLFLWFAFWSYCSHRVRRWKGNAAV